MDKVLKTFQAFMEEALIKSLPELTLSRGRPPEGTQNLLSARLCFEGKEIKAQAFLSCSEEFLQASCPLTRGTKKHPEPVIRDWLGELGNLILGRLKNRLLAHDVTIKITAPDFDGPWPREDDAESVSVWYVNDDSIIGLECVVEGKIPSIGDALPQTAEILPGDAIYRLNESDNERTELSVDLLSKIRSGAVDTETKISEPSELIAMPRREERRDEWKRPAEPFPMHFHSMRDKAPVKSRAGLSGLSWPSLNLLHIKFSSGMEMTLCPRTLLENETTLLEIEGVTLQITLESDAIRVSLPKLHMNFSKSLKEAG